MAKTSPKKEDTNLIQFILIKAYPLFKSWVRGMTSLAIVGSRSFSDYDRLKREIDTFYPDRGDISEIVSGGAMGADRLAERYARAHGIKMIILKPMWRNEKGVYNARAGLDRNKDIVNRADHVVAFWNGSSTGTLDSINYAKRKQKRCNVIEFD